MNQKLPDWTFDQSLLLTYAMMELAKVYSITHATFWCHTSRTCFNYCSSWEI